MELSLRKFTPATVSPFIINRPLLTKIRFGSLAQKEKRRAPFALNKGNIFTLHPPEALFVRSQAQTMERLAKGWFSEFSPNGNGENPLLSWKGQAFSLKVENVIYSSRSKYQDILVFQSESYGRVLVLDGIIQCTERDEFSYQEMMAHVPLHLHAEPRKVLIVGGGDGGVAREVLKHSTVETVVVVEIDKEVVDACATFFPNMAASFKDPRVQVHYCDGLEFLKHKKEKFDVIITDSTDPVGPGESLFGINYYQLLKESLNEGGVVMTQAESIWLHMDLIAKLFHFCKSVFPVAAYCYTMVPTYPSGVIGHLVCSNNKNSNPKVPLRQCSPSLGCKYYDSKVHEAAFRLPVFAKKKLQSA
uniref:PABS domain-containing protein n=1 Tax=Trichuris muris TaxID=70415 RepID=A0A5S6QB74_TRIMR